MNAALQCFLHTPQLLKAVIDKNFTDKYSGCSAALKELLYKFATNSSSYDYEKPSDLRRAIGKIYPQFSDYEQQDSFEFVLLFMETLNNEMNRVKSKPNYSMLTQDSSNLNELAEKWFNYSKSREDSIITDTFRGQTMSKVICACGFEHISFEDFLAISLPFPRSSTKFTHSNNLNQCLDEFIKKETITDDFNCNKCKKTQSCDKQVTIWRFPQVLILHLKRFNVSTWRKEKLDSLIEFPQTLDLSLYKGQSSIFLKITKFR